MRVALMNPVFWPEVRRGSERFARGLADGLLERGHDVRLITSHPRDVGTRVEDGLAVQRVWRPPWESRLRRRLHEEHLAHVPFAAVAVRRFHPDVAHALYVTDAVAALHAKRTTGRPVVFSYMGIPHRASLANRRGRKELVVQACREADAVVALSAVAAAGFTRWLGVTPRTIAPGVDLVAFAPDPAARATEPTILCAADHAQPRKRVGLLVEAFALLRRDVPDARLVLSSGPAGPSRWAGTPGIEERALDDRDALAQANREAWVHALPSVGEAFGLVLAEALACGTPVIGANAEVVGGPATGRRFDAGEESAAVLAEVLRATLELARDPDTAAACRAHAERFSTDATTTAYLRLYKEVGA